MLFTRLDDILFHLQGTRLVRKRLVVKGDVVNGSRTLGADLAIHSVAGVLAQTEAGGSALAFDGNEHSVQPMDVRLTQLRILWTRNEELV